MEIILEKNDLNTKIIAVYDPMEMMQYLKTIQMKWCEVGQPYCTTNSVFNCTVNAMCSNPILCAVV